MFVQVVDDTQGHTLLSVSTMDPSLREAEGIAREVISRVQRMRREAGLDVTDRIELGWRSADPLIRSAIDAHEAEIAAEVLARDIAETTEETTDVFQIDQGELGLKLSRATG